MRRQSAPLPSGAETMRLRRAAAVVIGGAMLATWTPLLISAVASLPTRGAFGRSDALIVTGAYARVRHPLYAGLSLSVSGLGLVAGSRRVVVAGASWLLITSLWSVPEEERLRERFGAEYDAYRLATPRVIPRCSRGAASGEAQNRRGR